MSSIGGFIRNFKCPHCGVLSQFNTSQWAHDKTGIVHGIGRCLNPECMRDSMFVYETKVSQGHFDPTSSIAKLIYHYPLSKIQVHQAIPTHIADSYKEGVSDLNINSQKSAVLMFRRALQEICKDKGANPQSNLNDQIDSIINGDLASLAHEIRLWGNIGGHPDDLIINVQPEDANQIKEFLEMVFEYLYIMPWKLQQSRAKRSGTP